MVLGHKDDWKLSSVDKCIHLLMFVLYVVRIDVFVHYSILLRWHHIVLFFKILVLFFIDLIIHCIFVQDSLLSENMLIIYLFYLRLLDSCIGMVFCQWFCLKSLLTCVYPPNFAADQWLTSDAYFWMIYFFIQHIYIYSSLLLALIFWSYKYSNQKDPNVFNQ